MRIQFERPYLLLLLIPIIAGIVISYRFQNEKKKHVKIKQTVLEGILFTLLVFAMAGIQTMSATDRVSTVFVLDSSASVSEYRDDMKKFINDALKTRAERDYVGIVVFGGDAQVEQFVSEINSINDIQSDINKNATNLEQALSMAASMIPEGSFGRIILMTDGVENEGAVSRLSGTTLLSDKELLIYQINPAENPEVYVSAIDVGDGNQVSKGDTINIVVNIKSNKKTSAKAYLYQGRVLVDQQEITLLSGDNSVLFTEIAEEEGLATYTVRVEATEDTIHINNEYSTYLNITREKKFLLVEDESSAKEFVNIINSLYTDGKSHADVCRVNALPNTINELLEYTGVVFVDVYATHVPDAFLAMLKTYVRDYGGGFVATGGHHSFGMGAYTDTVLEDILPVEMEPVEKDELPSMAIYYVIDKSGSMADSFGAANKLEVAKKATMESMASLIPGKDYVGVMSFDQAITRVIPVQKVTDSNHLRNLQSKVGGISIEGGTSILPALRTAIEDISKCDAKIKHVILLTDGEDGLDFSSYVPTMAFANNHNITVTTVAVGDGCNVQLLSDIAKAGGGNCHAVHQGMDLPKIFTQEIITHRKSYVRNVEFVPTQRLTSLNLLDGVSFDRSFKAYIATKLKGNAFELAYTHDEEEDEDFPILAAWQYGLGKTVAWTSDVTGEWSQNYSGSINFSKMWSNIFAYVSTYEASTEVYAKAEVSGDTATITYHTENGSAASKVEMIVTDADGKEQTVTLTPVGIKDYKGSFKMSQPGAYMVGVKRYENGQEIGEEAATTVAMMQYSEEYKIVKGAGDKVLNELKALTGAESIDKAEDAFKYVMRYSKGMKDITPILLVVAMVFFLYTVFYRRFRFDLIPEGTFSKLGRTLARTVGKAARKTAEKTGEMAKTVVAEDSSAELSRTANTASAPAKTEQSPAKAGKAETNQKTAKTDKGKEVLDTSQLLKRMKK